MKVFKQLPFLLCMLIYDSTCLYIRLWCSEKYALVKRVLKGKSDSMSSSMLLDWEETWFFIKTIVFKGIIDKICRRRTELCILTIYDHYLIVEVSLNASVVFVSRWFNAPVYFMTTGIGILTRDRVHYVWSTIQVFGIR